MTSSNTSDTAWMAGGIALLLTTQHDPKTWKLVKDVLHLA
jgi:hypothetical protein